MKFFTFYKRFLTLNKYPLFRTANFKHMLINILLISLMIALPNIISLFQSVSATTSLTSIESEIPEFSIVDGEYVGESKTIQIHGSSILFSGSRSTGDMTGADREVLIGFLKDGIYIRDVQGGGFDYSYISQVENNEDLETFIEQQTSSLYFYVAVYVVFYTAVIMFFAVILLSIGVYAMHLISSVLRKKSRFMNWFKFSTFATVLALIPIIGIQLAAGLTPWWIYLATLPFYFHYYRKLPAMK
ncbi:DUF1189 domain-containing protein [Salinicoccus cyprini]|uniref:DUF1189 domain-containing protein n=1 Tax=Salinicoccus cyprini TaxID=2493691 RepID=A0A558AYX6_9STAP|nr:DUF1189 family protein [Salinicoccus cyprini]TVT29453.1 DUF1189 domain-containing protein [Salinicoccus cyprini]